MQVAHQAGLIELGQAALSGCDLLALLQDAVDLVVSTLEVDYGILLEALPDGTILQVRASAGWEQDEVVPATVDVVPAIPEGYTLLSGEPVIVADWNGEARFCWPRLQREHQVRASLRVAVRGYQGFFGVLGADSKRPRSFEVDDVQFLQAVANVLGMAIERVRGEAALRASEARFRLLAENAADIIYRYHVVPSPGFDYVSPAAMAITGYAPADFYADPQLALQIAHPDDRPLLEALIHSPPASGGQLAVRVFHKDGRLVWTEHRLVPVLDTSGTLVGIEGIVRNVTESIQAYQHLEQRVEERTCEIERRRQVAEGLREILTILNSNLPVDDILAYVIAQACRLLTAPTGAIYRMSHQEERLTIRGAHGLAMEDPALILPFDWTIIDEVARSHRPVAVPSTRKTGPETLQMTSEAPAGTHSRRRRKDVTTHYHTLLLIPLIIKNDVYGLIVLFYPEPRAFLDEDLQLAMTVGDQAALAIQNARLVAAVQDKAVLEERQRLARDLHDSVTQALYSITLFAEAAKRWLLAGDVELAGDHLGQLQAMAQEALREMRLLIFELRPAVLEQAGLVAALQARLEAVEGRSNIAAKLVVEGDHRLPAPIEQALYRICQEALNNTLRHAKARQVVVTLRQEPSMVMLEVGDDGQGFDPALAGRQGGLGLCGIAERVALLDGQLIVQSAPGAGTRLHVEISL